MSIKYKITALVLAVSVVPIIAFFAYYDYISQQLVKSMLERLSDQNIAQTAIALNDRVESMENTMRLSAGNEEILEHLSNRELAGRAKFHRVSNHFGSPARKNQQIKTVAVLLFGEAPLVFGQNAEDAEREERGVERYMKVLDESAYKIVQMDIFKEVAGQDESDKAVWQAGLFDDDNIYALMPVNKGADRLGVIMFVMDPSFLLDLCYDDQENDVRLYVLDKEFSPIAVAGHNSMDAVNNSIEAIRQSAVPEENTHSVTAGEKLLSYRGIKNQWIIVYDLPKNIVVRDILPSSDKIIWILGISALSYILMGVVMSRMLTKRLTVITRKCEEVERGNLNISRTLKSGDEIGRLDEHFARMTTQLDRLIKQNYLQELENKEAQLRALQYQINPHFLYNTLDIISAMSDVGSCENIREVCENLGKLFRYNTGKLADGYATLSEELRHVANYIYLQQLNYSDSFSVFYDIDPATENVRVLKFILQPIVENAIIHGFCGQGKHCLEISSFVKNAVMHIQVRDDGAGITPGRLEELNEQINLPASEPGTALHSGIGLRNVNERIKLLYGERFGLEIVSQQQGTAVTIKLPFGNA